jgi:hypothetical protein
MRFHKYGAKRTEVDGIKFMSQSEANRYVELKLLERSGQIQNLSLQPRFTLQEGFLNVDTLEKERKIEYVADFMYTENNETIVEDVKGMKTADYKIKRKLFLFKYQNQYKHLET